MTALRLWSWSVVMTAAISDKDGQFTYPIGDTTLGAIASAVGAGRAVAAHVGCDYVWFDVCVCVCVFVCCVLGETVGRELCNWEGVASRTIWTNWGEKLENVEEQ